MINDENEGLGDYFFMIEPVILEIFLNKNNYKERLLINDLKKSARTIKIDHITEDTSFFVNASEVEEILYSKYRKEINNFDSTHPDRLLNTSNSIFFLESAIRGFQKLRYFRVHISDDEELVKTKGTIDYKIMHSKIDLAKNLIPEFYEKFIYIFKKIGLYNPRDINKKPYIEINVRELFYLLQKYQSNLEEDEEEFLVIEDIMDIFGPKLEADNSMVLIILEK